MPSHACAPVRANVIELRGPPASSCLIGLAFGCASSQPLRRLVPRDRITQTSISDFQTRPRPLYSTCSGRTGSVATTLGFQVRSASC